MAYSFLKFKDLLSSKKVVYLPIRVSNEFNIFYYTFNTAVFDTNFPNLSKKNSGTTLTLSLPRKSGFLKSPNRYIKKLTFQVIKKYKYQLVQKDENGKEYDSYIFEFAILGGWVTANTILPGTDTPKYYEQSFESHIVFRVLDTELNDITNTVFLEQQSPFAPEGAYYPKGYYVLGSLFGRNYIPSYDVNEGTSNSDRCWANYDIRGFDDKLAPINYYILFYYFENKTNKYLTYCSGYDNDFFPGCLRYSYFANAYASFNNSGVEYNLSGHAGLSTPSFATTIQLSHSPVVDSETDISDDTDSDEQIKSTDDNSINYGNGIGEDTTEYIDFPSLTSENPATKSGIYRLVKMDVENLTKLSKFLWSTNPLDTLIKVFSKPFDCIISLQTLPYNVTANSSTSELKILDYSTGVNVYKSVYTSESLLFGTCECSESFGNFLDYETTKVSIFLPYIGMQPLDVQDVMDAVLTLVYNVDNQTGQCVALLKCTKNNMDVDSVTYSWSGNLANLLPLTGADNTQYIQGLFNSISSVAVGASGGVISNTFNTIMQGDKQIIKSGRLDSNTGNLSIQFPYIKIERPIWARPNNYLDMLGQPYFAEDTLSNLSGFVKVTEVKSELNGVPEESRDRIIELLKDGVYI